MNTEKTEPNSPTSQPGMAELIEYAGTLVWKQPDVEVLLAERSESYPPLAHAIQEAIRDRHGRGKLLLPDLRAHRNQSVGVFSDFGGEDKSAKYATYSTLVCGWNLCGPFHERMKAIREKHGLKEKEIAFKDFGMGPLLRSLPDYLDALDLVPGFLFTLAVDRRLTSLFGPPGKETEEQIAHILKSAGLGDRKPAVNEKLLRVAHLTAFLTGLLAHNGQRIFWMTDSDAISANRDMHEKTVTLYQRLLEIYARGRIFPVLRGALPFKPRSLQMLDLLSATDIVAGALNQYLSQWETVAETDIQVKEGCQHVLQWLAHEGVGLKKMVVRMHPGASDNTLQTSTQEWFTEHPPTNVTIIPVSV